MSEVKPFRPAAAYATLYPRLAEIARSHGYALALHGSMARDMDVIAVPWVEEAAAPGVLAEALREAVDGVFWPNDSNGCVMAKEHGRRCWVIHFETGGTDYIDLSIMPRIDVRYKPGEGKYMEIDRFEAVDTTRDT